jgi:ABC-2 type transport system ATP-binding protein
MPEAGGFLVRTGIESAVAAVLLAVAEIPSPTPTVPFVAAVVAGIAAGGVLVPLLALTPRIPLRPKRGRARLLLAAGAVLAIGSACEEIVWRWAVMGTLAQTWGIGWAYLASTAGFALSHGSGRAIAVHLLTGATFGGVYIATGSLASCIAAHVAYNLLVLLAVEGGRCKTAALAAGSVIPVALRHVTKRFRGTTALDRLSLEVGEGQVVALLGPNGAGKTTALRITVGLRKPDSGEALLFGRDPRDSRSRSAVGVTPQDTGFPGTLRVREVIAFARAHYERPLAEGDTLAAFGLAPIARRQIGGLSGGERRRLAVALAFVGGSRLVVLDEPTTGLDVESRLQVWDAIHSYAAGGGSVLLTTHYLEEAEALATRIAMIAGGRIVRAGTPAEIKRGAESLEQAFLASTRTTS